MKSGARRERILFYCELAIIFSVFTISVLDLVARQNEGQQFDPIVDTIRVVGLVFFLTGFVIRMLARRTLGKFFSTQLRVLDDHEIVTDGIYHYIRHPAYLGLLCIFLAVPLLFYSLYGFILIVLGIPDVIYRIRREEGMLITRFGNRYLEYMKTSKKLLPYMY
jgi:protein-S-isoprenylcysteine O-methyltransferase Ste14